MKDLLTHDLDVCAAGKSSVLYTVNSIYPYVESVGLFGGEGVGVGGP
jgi:hypothetical protein